MLCCRKDAGSRLCYTVRQALGRPGRIGGGRASSGSRTACSWPGFGLAAVSGPAARMRQTVSWAGRCCSFSVVDCFTRKWISYAFDTRATRHAAIDSITNAVAAEKPDCPRPRIRTDNGNRSASHDFGKAVRSLGISKREFIWKSTPEQSGHVESFHKTLKREYIWPRKFGSYQDAGIALEGAFADYDSRRIHSAIGCMTPTGFAMQWELRNK